MARPLKKDPQDYCKSNIEYSGHGHKIRVRELRKSGKTVELPIALLDELWLPLIENNTSISFDGDWRTFNNMKYARGI